MSIFELSVTGAVLIFAVILFRAVGKKRLPMRTFTVLWHVALLRLFLPVELPSPISAASIGQKLIRSWKQAGLWKETVMSNSAPAQAIPQDPVLSGSAGGTILFESGFPTDYPVSGAPLTAVNARFAPDWRLIVWIAGAVLLLAVFTAFYIRSVKRFRQSLPLESDFARDWLATHAPHRRIEVRRSDRIDSPLTYGVLRPVILLPSDLDLSDTKRLEFVLAHELTHIRHFDSLTKLLLALAVSLHWFNPAVWGLFLFFNRDMELACDEAVVRMFGEDTRRDYALMLLELVEKKNPPPLPANGFGQVAIRERIGAIMKVRRITWAASLTAVIAVCGITAVFATTAAQEISEEPELPEQTELLEQTEKTEEALRLAEEQAQLQAELEEQLRLEAEQQHLLKWKAAVEKWDMHGQIYDRIREILLTGTESREDRLADLDALILEYRGDFEYAEGRGMCNMWLSGTAEGEPEWKPDADMHYEAQTDYYRQFAPFGVRFEESPTIDIGDVFWNGRPVTSWEDILFSDDGKTVRRFYVFEDNDTDAVSVRVVYDGDKIAGVEVNPNR